MSYYGNKYEDKDQFFFCRLLKYSNIARGRLKVLMLNMNMHLNRFHHHDRAIVILRRIRRKQVDSTQDGIPDLHGTASGVL